MGDGSKVSPDPQGEEDRASGVELGKMGLEPPDRVGWVRLLARWAADPELLVSLGCSKDTPILGLGRPPSPPAGHKRLYAARSGSPELNSAFVAALAGCVAGGGAWGPAAGKQQAGSGRAEGRELGPARGWPQKLGTVDSDRRWRAAGEGTEKEKIQDLASGDRPP